MCCSCISLFNRSFFLQITGYVVTNHSTAITTITKKCFAKFFVVNSNLIHRGGIMSPKMQRFTFILFITIFCTKLLLALLTDKFFLKSIVGMKALAFDPVLVGFYLSIYFLKFFRKMSVRNLSSLAHCFQRISPQKNIYIPQIHNTM